MALVKCLKCGKETSDRAVVCPYCGYAGERNTNTETQDTVDISDQKLNTAHVNTNRTEDMLGQNFSTAEVKSDTKTDSVFHYLVIAAVILALLATGFLSRGFYVKNVYANSSSSDDYYYDSDDDINAYVGGDSYNYIINGTYFTGFMVLSGAMYICATGMLCTALVLRKKDKSKNLKEEDLPSI